MTKCCGRQHGFSSIVSAAADGQPGPQHMEHVSCGHAGREREKDSWRQIRRALQGEEVCSLFSVFEKWPREIKLPGV